MADSNLSDPEQQPTSRDPVADYLATVSAQLPGPIPARATVTDELRDGLLEALEAYQGRGCSLQKATAAAIAEFGDPRMVAAAFGPELAAVQARRVALGLLATGPLVGLAWIAAVTVNTLPPWRHQLTGPWLALPLVGLSGRRRSSPRPDRRRHRPAEPMARWRVRPPGGACSDRCGGGGAGCRAG